MHYEQYFQIAHENEYLDAVATLAQIENATGEEKEALQTARDAMLASLTTCRRLQQAHTVYKNLRGCCGDWTSATGMVIRHLEFSNGAMQDMWSKAVMTQNFALIPFKIDEVNAILANEPQQNNL